MHTLVSHSSGTETLELLEMLKANAEGPSLTTLWIRLQSAHWVQPQARLTTLEKTTALQV